MQHSDLFAPIYDVEMEGHIWVEDYVSCSEDQ